MAPSEHGRLFPEPDETDTGSVFVNERCRIQTGDDHRVVSVAGVVLAHYAVGDRMAEAYAMVTLVDQGRARQTDVARAFGVSERTVRRHQRRFEVGGLAALGRPSGYPRGRPRVPTDRGRRVHRWKSEGLSSREIARRLGVTEKAVRKHLRQLGWKTKGPKQLTLDLTAPSADPNLSAPAPPPAEPAPPRAAGGADPNLSAAAATEPALPPSLDADPADRRADRLLAALGLLDDAAPLFGHARGVPGAGVLLALPALAGSGVLECAREVYGSLAPAFYGLRTTLVTLLCMALLRIKRPESLKERSPRQLGQVLGLDRAPEVKTLRRKLGQLATAGRAADFGRALARRRVATRGPALGFLYIDGHVRVYHGRRPLPHAHVARMRLAMPATTDYWVNDAAGEPLFVVTTEANRGLVRMLPVVLAEVRTVLGERRVTVVFDRGGWSPKLFAQLLADGFDLLTYRKGRVRPVPARGFRWHEGTLDGHALRYELADQGIYLGYGTGRQRRRLRLRQVTRRSPDGHQTPIVTSRRDLSALEIAHRMFERWRQENFFKYLREEYALDALVDYGTEPADAARDVPNPVRRRLDAELQQARRALARVQAAYGLEALENPEQRRRTMRGFKIANAPLGRELRAALRRVTRLEQRRAKVPARVPVRDVVEGEVVKLAVERKHLTDLLKMVAYQAESELVRAVAPHYRRTEDEGRTLIQTALAASGDLEVSATELRVRLGPLSAPHRTAALEALCAKLTTTRTCFPGTRLRLRYSVAPPPPAGRAFPGPRASAPVSVASKADSSPEG